MKQVIVGKYYIGPESVEIVLREGVGGEFYCTPEPGHIARIKIGGDCDWWREVVAILFHEAMELVYDRIGCRYYPASNMSRDSEAHLMVVHHREFSDACSRVADLISACIADLEKEWKKFNSKRSR